MPLLSSISFCHGDLADISVIDILSNPFTVEILHDFECFLWSKLFLLSTRNFLSISFLSSRFSLSFRPFRCPSRAEYCLSLVSALARCLDKEFAELNKVSRASSLKHCRCENGNGNGNRVGGCRVTPVILMHFRTLSQWKQVLS